ncbi:MAG: PUR family DNA/RNA-binding protein, partial [Bacteroidales bacterium]|nr:PUR family DNA/RNA-binding protein [Bacteroidales bacterium]
TESKRLFDENLNKFVYDKHKILQYKEDFDNFVEGLQTVIRFIQTGEAPVEDTLSGDSFGTSGGFSAQDDMEFENLGK